MPHQDSMIFASKKHEKSRQYGRLICPAASTTWPSTSGTAARFPAQPCPVPPLPSLLFVCLPPSPVGIKRVLK